MWKVSIGPADDLAPPAPQLILTGQVGEATESRLATITRRVVRLEATAFWVDDGSGPARVNFVSTTGLRRPAVRRGETWTATGVVIEHTQRTDKTPAYRLQPRYASD